MTAALIALATVLYQPLPLEKMEIHILPDGSPWAVAYASVSVPADGATLAWDLAQMNADAARARLNVPPTLDLVWSTLRGSTAMWHLQPADGTPRTEKVRVCAPIRDLKSALVYRVAVNGDTLRWTEALKLSDWKGQSAGPMPVVVGDVRLEVELVSGRAVEVPVRTYEGLAFREVVRWDSKNSSAGCVRTVILERPVTSEFGRRRLRAGELTIVRGKTEVRSNFPGAAPGEPVELAAGRAEGVSVSRLRAASKQVNVRQDVHRRLAAYDEQIDYEYAVMNGSTKPIVLEIVEHPARGWKVSQASHRWWRKDADTLVLSVELKPRERTTVRATVVRANQVAQ